MDVISYENCLIIIVVLYGMGKLQFVVLTLIRGIEVFKGSFWIPLVDFIHVQQQVNSAIRRSVKWYSANWTRTLCLQRSVPIKSMVNVQLCIAEIHTGVVGFPILAYPVNFCKCTMTAVVVCRCRFQTKAYDNTASETAIRSTAERCGAFRRTLADGIVVSGRRGSSCLTAPEIRTVIFSDWYKCF